jgi:nonsense-mediated mRNA decay protein 3
MFCIKCGKTATVGNFCDDHFLEREELFKINNISFYICDRCGAYLDGEWKPIDNMDNVVAGMIEKNIKTKNRITNVDIRLKPFGNKFTATVRCTGLIKPCKKPKTEEKKIIVIMKKKKCDNCVKLLGNYYEAVVQMRGERKDQILDRIKKITNAKTIGSFKEVADGYDLYFIKKADANRIGKSLKKHYIVKFSFKFAAEKKGKKLYRNYFSVR